MTFLMDQETASHDRTATPAGGLQQKLAAIPKTAWIVMALFSAAAVLLGLHAARATDQSASLHIKVQHGLRSGQLAVWIDGHQACSEKLTGYVRKKFGLIPESVRGSLSRTLPLASGGHEIRVQVSGDDGFNQEDSVTGTFVRNTERTLAVAAGRSGLALAWQGESNVPVENSSSLAWLGRYASTLLVTIAGSIISALTGFAVREVPAYMRNRQAVPNSSQSATVPSLPSAAPAELPSEAAPKARSAATGR